MKIVISALGINLESSVDPRFGRAVNFLVFDTDTNRLELVKNKQNQQAAQGAGIQAGQRVASTGAEVVLTGNCGPKAFQVLQKAGIKVCVGAKGTVKQAIQDYTEGKLKPTQEANVEGHWM